MQTTYIGKVKRIWLYIWCKHHPRSVRTVNRLHLIMTGEYMLSSVYMSSALFRLSKIKCWSVILFFSPKKIMNKQPSLLCHCFLVSLCGFCLWALSCLSIFPVEYDIVMWVVFHCFLLSMHTCSFLPLPSTWLQAALATFLCMWKEV